MKTRTLLVLAALCGVAIMLAGAALVVQLRAREPTAPPAAVGEPVQVGDLTVTVGAAEERDGVLAVVVDLAGADVDDAVTGFELIASGRPLAPRDVPCQVSTATPVSCRLEFGTATADTPSRVLLYRRGDDQQRWVLTP